MKMRATLIGMTTTSLLASAMLFIGTASAHGESEKVWANYQDLAQELMTDVDTKPLNAINEKAKDLTKLSTRLLPHFVKRQSECEAYINAAIDASDNMMKLTQEEIERDYHADGKLPPMKKASCYHAKDLLVHPATVAVISATMQDSVSTRQQLKAELAEVLEHFEEVKRAAVQH
ncbi:hypothetical protein [Flocculibacter collagenilyticus]|uniref:hypothetical protein n=1 Tax=Flocculibacter collagenilyticus TaxID=2744479 RepID=UPI0018F4C52F|nr:hypothetical protein [Flocculibacter collagenilyticus]